MAHRAANCDLPEWPGYSASLSPLDYWLWDAIKAIIAEQWKSRPNGWPQNLADMETAVEAAIPLISQDEINKAILDFPKKLRLCKEADGFNFEHLTGVERGALGGPVGGL